MEDDGWEESGPRVDSVVETQNILLATPAEKARARTHVDSTKLPTDSV